MAFTQPTYVTDNNQTQPDQPTLSASAFKLLLDQVGIDTKNYLIGLLAELAALSASDNLGHTSASITAETIGAALEENRLAIVDAILGQIPDNSLTELKMAAEMKKQAGGVAEFDTVATDVTNLDILRLAELDTGAADAYVVTTAGTFSRVDGNTLPFIPANNNTGASTINEDGNGVATIQKYVDGAWIALEEGDLNKFQQVQLVWNASESAFQLAPKGGAVVKSLQRGSTTIPASTVNKNVSITAVDMSKTYVKVTYTTNDASTTSFLQTHTKITLTSTTNIEISRGVAAGGVINAEWEVIEFNDAIVQRGTANPSVVQNVTISAVDLSKTFVDISYRDCGSFKDIMSGQLTSTTNLQLNNPQVVSAPNISWQVVEFK